jgi:hypothetical protein
MSQRGSQNAPLAVDSSAVTGALTNVINQRDQHFLNVRIISFGCQSIVLVTSSVWNANVSPQHIEGARTQLLDVALTVSDMGSSELVSWVSVMLCAMLKPHFTQYPPLQLSVLKEEYAGLLRLEQEVKAHQGALLDVAREYQPPTQANNPSDLDKKLAKKTKRHMARDGWVQKTTMCIHCAICAGKHSSQNVDMPCLHVAEWRII